MVVGALSVQAQYTLTVGGTDYPLQIADVGQFEGDLITANIAAIGDACGSMDGVSGAIAVMNLSDACHPAASATAASNAGAVATIVCGITNSNGNLFFPFETNDDGAIISGSGVTTPTFTMDATQCETILAATGTSAMLELKVADCMRDIPANAVWGLNGEGEFDGGLNGWTISNDNGFKYDAKGKLDRGAYNNNANQIGSPTLCNGAVVADSSFGDNGGEPGNFQSGLCPSASGVFCETELTSPVIDLSSVETDGIFLQFFQAVRQFNSEFQLLVSTDGGSTFPDTIALNSQVETNSDHIQENVTVPLCGVDGASELVLRFRYRGYYYYWAIDDVFLLNDGFADARVNENFTAQVPSYESPVSQNDQIALLADLENIGNGPARDLVLEATVFNEDSGQIVSMASLNYEDLAGCMTDENHLFTDLLNMPNEKGSYRLIYDLKSSNDNASENNTRTLNFKISDNTFAKCEASDATASIAFPDQAFFTLANAYHVTNSKDADGDDLYINEIRVGIDGSAENAVPGTVNVSVYEWVDLNNNQEVDQDLGVGVPERNKVYSTSILVIGADEGLNDYTISLGADAIKTKDNTTYLITISGNPNDANQQYRFLAADSEANRNYYYGATALAWGPGSADGTLPEGGLGTVTENPLNMTRVGSMGGTGSGVDDEDTRRLFQVNNFTALINMFVAKEGVTNTEEINEQIGVTVFPNPATTNVTVELALENVSDNVNLQFIDAQGKVVKSVDYNNVINDKLNVNVEDLTTGVYMINIRTAEGMTSTRFIKG